MSFDLYKFFYQLNEQEVQNEPQQPQMQQPQQTPDQIAKTQAANQPSGSEVFRKLQGQIIANVEFSPNGSNGGVLKIKVKNSYQPFVVSWVNGQVTVTDMSGKTIMLSDNNPA